MIRKAGSGACPRPSCGIFKGLSKTYPTSDEKLKDLLRSKGFRFPVFVWYGHDLILDGKQRLFVCQNEGWEVEGGVPVVDIEASGEEIPEPPAAPTGKSFT